MIEMMMRRAFPEQMEGFMNRNTNREMLSWTEEWTPDGSLYIVKNVKSRETLRVFVSHYV